MSFIFKIKIRGISKPPVWRRVSVPETFTFADLHLVIQAAFGWTNSHLYEFVDSLYNPALKFTDTSVDLDMYDLGGMDSRKSKLNRYFLESGDKMVYTYDFGDNWEHDVVLEEIRGSKDSEPSCIAGKGACPPEDCGGIYGYEMMKEDDHVDPTEFDIEDADDAVKHWHLLEDIRHSLRDDDDEEDDEDLYWGEDEMFGIPSIADDEQIKKAISDAVMLLASGKSCYVDFTNSTCSRTKPKITSKFCIKLNPPTEKQKIALARDFIKSIPKKDAGTRSSLALSLNAVKPMEAFTQTISQSDYADSWVEAMHDFYSQIVAFKSMELYSHLLEELASLDED